MHLLTIDEFRKHKPGKDIYEADNPSNCFDGLKARTRGKTPKLSYLISTWNRHAQLSRALECLARQTMDDFEVLLADDGSTQDIESYVDPFREFIPIKVYRMPRETWRSCPSLAFSKMLPDAKGEVVAIAHPEIMLPKNALSLTYDALHTKRDDCYYYKIAGKEQYPNVEFNSDDYTWVTFKSLFVEGLYRLIDTVDWHSDVDNLRNISGFWKDVGFAGRENRWHYERQSYPWWFFGATFRDNPIWKDMEITEEHGVIDMWFITYRHTNKFTDITPIELTCYHQAHLKTAIPVANS